jgi:hypothetical protein
MTPCDSPVGTAVCCPRRDVEAGLWPDSGGFIVAAEDARRFAAEIPGASVVEVQANHFGVLTDLHAIEAISGFLVR